ncbi:arylesterase [Patescibacteria group bacterium]|nr:MAG: arylesterase [Patescibacteria group bacterium]
MRRALFVLILLTLGAGIYFLFLLPRGYDIKNYPSSGRRIVAFGDSLIEGVGATEGEDLVSVLSRTLDVSIENYGRGGDTTALALERLPSVLEEVPEPKAAIILLGGNDFLQKVSKEEIFGNLAKIITAFQDRGAVVLVLGIRGGLIKDNFEGEFEQLAHRHRTAYVSNILRGLVTNRELMFDSIHPNDKGYERIASRVAPVLKKIIE